MTLMFVQTSQKNDLKKNRKNKEFVFVYMKISPIFAPAKEAEQGVCSKHS